MKVGIIMAPLETIQPEKSTDFALLLTAQQRGHEIFYLPPEKIYWQGGLTWATTYPLHVEDRNVDYYTLKKPLIQPLVELDLVFMRQEPPFNMSYIELTYLLEQAQSKGLRIINNPTALRDANEKLFTQWFPQCCPNTLFSSQKDTIKNFLSDENSIVLKPTDGMGGQSIFQLTEADPNLNSIIDAVTQGGTRLAMAQSFLDVNVHGDKRVLLIDGKPIPYAWKRHPSHDDFRANLAAGGRGELCELTDHDYWIAEQLAPTLRKKGLVFVGLDIIDDHLTEINVTSPTCAREMTRESGIDVCANLFESIESNETHHGDNETP